MRQKLVLPFKRGWAFYLAESTREREVGHGTRMYSVTFQLSDFYCRLGKALG